MSRTGVREKVTVATEETFRKTRRAPPAEKRWNRVKEMGWGAEKLNTTFPSKDGGGPGMEAYAGETTGPREIRADGPSVRRKVRRNRHMY